MISMYRQVSREIEFRDVNLYKYPDTKNTHINQTVTVGDMHGNAMKLIWILCHLGILELQNPREEWGQLWLIYKTPVNQLTYLVLQEFKNIVDTARIGRQHPGQMIFIGDILADRGENDLFTVMVFAKIHGVIPFKILLSNHDVYTLFYLEDRTKVDELQVVAGRHSKRSFLNFLKLARLIPLVVPEFKSLISRYYIPHLTLFAYEMRNQDNYALYSHAVFNLKHLISFLEPGKSFAKDFDSVKRFLTFIDSINVKMFKWLDARCLHLKDPLISKIIWEREYDESTFAFLRDLGIINVHGHVAIPIIEKDRISLDTGLGRSMHLKKSGDYFPETMEGPLGVYSTPYAAAFSSLLPSEIVADESDSSEQESISQSSDEESESSDAEELPAMLQAHLGFENEKPKNHVPSPRFFQSEPKTDELESAAKQLNA